MNKNLLLAGFVALGLCVGMTSCDKDDDDKGGSKEITEEEAQALEYTSANAAAWGNYATNVALLLSNDSKKLYDEWNSSYASDFKTHSAASGYSSANACVQQIIEGCIDIANEVGTAKIGEPVDYWTSGKKNQALYAVESWYSWHSRDDYKNNILSIANSVLGQRIEGAPSKFNYQTEMQKGTLTMNSIVVKCMQNAQLRAKAITVWTNIGNAWDAIDEIPQPFRNNIGSEEAEKAMDACAELVKSLEELKPLIEENMSEDDCQAIVDQFVDNVALPTYKELVTKNNELLASVKTLQSNPSNAAFESACAAWLAARQPWETSESFLFGPVSELGLDPNMDSWPLDAVGIYNLLISEKWSDMEWSGDYEEADEDNPSAHASAIEAAQAVRGFHTLEFLLFKDGTPRKIK